MNVSKDSVEVTTPPGEPVFYANMCGIQVSPEEIILHFARRNPDHPDQAQGLVQIYTNLAHAKRLAAALAQTIKQYEELFGEIDADPAATALAKLQQQGEGQETTHGHPA